MASRPSTSYNPSTNPFSMLAPSGTPQQSATLWQDIYRYIFPAADKAGSSASILGPAPSSSKNRSYRSVISAKRCQLMAVCANEAQILTAGGVGPRAEPLFIGFLLLPTAKVLSLRGIVVVSLCRNVSIVLPVSFHST